MGFGEHGKRALLLWNRGTKPTFEGNEGNIGITGYIRKQIFDFLKTGTRQFISGRQGNRCASGRASSLLSLTICLAWSLHFFYDEYTSVYLKDIYYANMLCSLINVHCLFNCQTLTVANETLI